MKSDHLQQFRTHICSDISVPSPLFSSDNIWGDFLRSTYSTGTSSTMMSLALNSQRKWAVNYLIKENLSSVELLDLSNKIEKREKIHSHITRPGLLVQAKVIKASNMTVFESKPILIKASLVHLFFFLCSLQKWAKFRGEGTNSI